MKSTNKEKTMTKYELKYFLELLMCSDPWPITGGHSERTLKDFANTESRRHGFTDWIDAYHKLVVKIQHKWIS